jgi:hypothetical protein
VDLKRRLANLDRLARKPAADGLAEAAPRGPACGPGELGLEAAPSGLWVTEATAEVAPPAVPGVLEALHPDHWPSCAGPGELLFLDTETTGLAGGTGTVAFLVGLAWWEAGRLRIRQIFLPGPEHEAALMEAVAEAAAGRRLVVSYNGAGFDWPLLRTRALLNRCEDPLAALGGWDLLVPARRVWGRMLPDCRQQTIETEICGRTRGPGDIPGGEIPQTWFDFLAGRDPEPLRRVLTHNRRDMEGMARVLTALAEVARDLDDPRPAPDVPWAMGWSLARACERRRADAAAAGWVRAAAQDEHAGCDLRFVADGVRLLKRDGDFQGALGLIGGALQGGCDESWLHREAAIIWEHRLGNPQRALAHALRTGEDRRVDRLRRRSRADRTEETP